MTTKAKNTAQILAYVAPELRAFLEEDLKHNRFRSLSQEVNHALTEYAISKGFQPEKIEEDRMVNMIVNDPLLSEAVLKRLLKNLTLPKCLCA